jgi:aromatic-L-amino-acid decarboxylase
VLPEYLRNAAGESGSVIDYRDWNVSLGRRFRALKLWFVLRHYGARGLRHHVARHVELAQGLAARVEADDRFLLATPCALNLVCLRHVGGDEPTERILAEVNRRGDQFLTHTRIDDHYVIRVCVGQTHTDARHVDALWAAIDALA